MVMSLKNLFTISYGEKTYKHAVDLQKMKVKASIAKNQLIFLERSIKNNILPKSFRLKPPVKSIKVITLLLTLYLKLENLHGSVKNLQSNLYQLK